MGRKEEYQGSLSQRERKKEKEKREERIKKEQSGWMEENERTARMDGVRSVWVL